MSVDPARHDLSFVLDELERVRAAGVRLAFQKLHLTGALREIAAIPNQELGGDMHEISQAREIAADALREFDKADGHPSMPRPATREQVFDNRPGIAPTSWQEALQLWRACERFHGIVDEETREHVADASCWCQPAVDYVDPESGATVYIHRERQ